MRAHTQPLNYRKIGNAYVSQQMSKRAERNYERWLAARGRRFDFSEITKIYPLPEDKTISVDVKRTFNCGAFEPLLKALEAVDDPELRQRVLGRFRHE